MSTTADPQKARGGSADLPAAGDAGSEAAFGEFLRRARERRQMTVAQISSETKISSRHLNALEQGNVQALPSGMYRRAMLRAYAESVGLDTDAALEQFERTFEQPARLPAGKPAEEAAPLVVAPPVRQSAAAQPRDTRLLLASVVLAAIVVVALVTGDVNQQPVSAEQGTAGERIAGAAPSPASAQPDTLAAVPQEQQAAGSSEQPVAMAADGRTTEPMAAQRAGAPARTVPTPAPPPAPDPVLATTGTGEGEAETRPPAARPISAQLVIVSEPTGARVTVNGTGWGVTPVTVRHLPFGPKRIRVTKDGYRSEERLIDPRSAATVQFTLSPQTAAN
jgi:cytoskeletal protein RodZ